jgi:hypothetical protein
VTGYFGFGDDTPATQESISLQYAYARIANKFPNASKAKKNINKLKSCQADYLLRMD